MIKHSCIKAKVLSGVIGTALARATWFDALHSARRDTMIAEVATGSYALFGRLLQARDWLGAFPELAGRAIWAIDG